MTKGICYYTDLSAQTDVLIAAQTQLCRTAASLPIAIVSCGGRAVDFLPEEYCWRGSMTFIVLPAPRAYLTMFKQILAGLEALDTDIAFLTEHDVLYSESHFSFTPPRSDCYYYNVHTYKVDATTGRAVTYLTKQTSGLCANRELLIAHYRERIRRVEAEGFSRRMGFEPGSHGRPERIDDVPSESWRSAVPNIDIRHGSNLTASRWSPDEFRTKPTEWQEVEAVPGWGVVRNRFKEFLRDVSAGPVHA